MEYGGGHVIDEGFDSEVGWIVCIKTIVLTVVVMETLVQQLVVDPGKAVEACRGLWSCQLNVCLVLTGHISMPPMLYVSSWVQAVGMSTPASLCRMSCQ